MIAVEVKLWGTTIGALSMMEGDSVARFEYAPNFIGAGIEPSPIVMPVSNRIYSFPSLSGTFHGLPGLFADSIPDKFGNRVIDSWLLRQGRSPESFTALERLCYTGNRGMGALEFYPVQGPESPVDDYNFLILKDEENDETYIYKRKEYCEDDNLDEITYKKRTYVLFDERGDDYLALYNLADKIFMNIDCLTVIGKSSLD